MESPNQNKNVGLLEISKTRTLLNRIASEFGYLVVMPVANVLFPRYSSARYTALSVVRRLEGIGIPKKEKQ